MVANFVILVLVYSIQQCCMSILNEVNKTTYTYIERLLKPVRKLWSIDNDWKKVTHIMSICGFLYIYL